MLKELEYKKLNNIFRIQNKTHRATGHQGVPDLVNAYKNKIKEIALLNCLNLPYIQVTLSYMETEQANKV